MTITIKSTVLGAPESRLTADGGSVLIVALAGDAGWPFEVRVQFGAGLDAAVKAAHYARRIRPGDHVTVDAAGCSPRSDHGLAVNALRRVSWVQVRNATECFVVPGLLR